MTDTSAKKNRWYDEEDKLTSTVKNHDNHHVSVSHSNSDWYNWKLQQRDLGYDMYRGTRALEPDEKIVSIMADMLRSISNLRSDIYALKTEMAEIKEFSKLSVEPTHRTGDISSEDAYRRYLESIQEVKNAIKDYRAISKIETA